MPAVVLVLVYIVLTITPILLAWAQRLPPRPVLDELASGLGLVALAILLVEFVLSGRFRSISSRIGLDVTMRFHQLLARTAAVFLLAHPFLYRTPDGLPAPDDLVRQSRLSSDPAGLATGTLAWLIVLTLVVTAIFRNRLPYRYENWRAAHAIGAVAAVGLSLHHVLVMGRYAADPASRAFWLVLTAIALSTLVFVYGVKPIAKSRRPYAVSAVRSIGLRIWELTLTPRGDHRLSFAAGQFVWLSVGRRPSSPNENPFSIASAPSGGPDLSFVIKENGDFTGAIGGTEIGAVAYVDGPHGNLTLAQSGAARGVALIAGGVGIAPMLSILRELAATGERRPIVLLYGNRVADQIVHREELDALAAGLDLRLEFVLSEPPEGWTGRTGIIDARTVASVFTAPDRGAWVYLLCGPPAMMAAAEASLIDIGVPADSILSERFDYD